MFFITLINYGTLFYNRTRTIKKLGVQLNSKLHCHAHLDHIFPQSVRMLGLKSTEICSSSTLLILQLTVVGPNSEYASTVWISITSTAAKSCIAFSASWYPVLISFLYL